MEGEGGQAVTDAPDCCCDAVAAQLPGVIPPAPRGHHEAAVSADPGIWLDNIPVAVGYSGCGTGCHHAAMGRLQVHGPTVQRSPVRQNGGVRYEAGS